MCLFAGLRRYMSFAILKSGILSRQNHILDRVYKSYNIVIQLWVHSKKLNNSRLPGLYLSPFWTMRRVVKINIQIHCEDRKRAYIGFYKPSWGLWPSDSTIFCFLGNFEVKEANSAHVYPSAPCNCLHGVLNKPSVTCLVVAGVEAILEDTGLDIVPLLPLLETQFLDSRLTLHRSYGLVVK